MGFIYIITNKINGKNYIGQTRREIETRWKEHQRKIKFYKDRLPLYKALNKYGVDNFKISCLEECEDKILDEREIYWIKYYKSNGQNGYNCTNGGMGINMITTYDEDVEDMVERYLAGERLDKLCNEYGHSYNTIRREFLKRDVKIDTFAGPKKLSLKVKALNPTTKEVVATYSSISEAARAICPEGKSFRAIGNHISKYKNTKTISHGYLWETD